MGVDLHGFEEFEKLLSGTGKRYKGARSRFLKAQAELLIGSARKKTPVDTGGLRLAWKRTPPKGETITVYNNTEYAAHVEYGHRVVSRKGGKKVYTGRVVPGAKMLQTAADEERAAFLQNGRAIWEVLFP